jgi:zinc transport system substrate-binding protein
MCLDFYFMNKKYLIKIFIFASVSLVIGLVVLFVYKNAISRQTSKNNKISVVTSFYPLYFIASQLGGDSVEVINLTPAGTEPHDYDLTTGDILKIKNSRVLVLNGGGLEIWRDSLENSLGDKNALKIISMDDLINLKSPETILLASKNLE